MVNFPSSLDDNSSLYLAVNNLRTLLTSDISDSATTIPVLTTSGYPPTGFTSILTGSDITASEAMSYSGLTATSFTGVARGADETVAAEHLLGNNVDLNIVADHHNSLKDAIFAIEAFVGISGAENFVPRDSFGNSIILNDLTVAGELTVSGAADLAWVAVSGTAIVGGDADFKEDVVITGTVTVGSIPSAGSTGIVSYFSEDVIVADAVADDDSTVSPTFDWRHFSPPIVSPPFRAGNNLVLFKASAGNMQTPGFQAIGLRATYAGLEIAEAVDVDIGDGITDGIWGKTDFSGFKVVTGNDVDVLELEHNVPGTRTADVGAIGIVGIPLDDMGLVENTDYFFSGSSGTGANTSWKDLNSYPITLPEDGDYIVFGYCEGTAASDVIDFQCRYAIDGDTISSTYSREGQISPVSYRPFPYVGLQNITSGLHTFRVQIKTSISSASFTRGRFVIIKASAFDQVSGLTSTANISTSNTIFSELAGTILDYTPNVSETLLVLANPDGTTSDIESRVAYKLHEDVSNIDYRIDSGAPLRSTSSKVPSLTFALSEGFTSTTWSLFHREAESTGSAITTTNVNMVAWGTSTTVTQDTAFTTIDGGKVRSHSGEFDNLTVSGVPVATGTAGAAA